MSYPPEQSDLQREQLHDQQEQEQHQHQHQRRWRQDQQEPMTLSTDSNSASNPALALPPHQQGINIHQALSILSERGKCDDSHHDHSHDGRHRSNNNENKKDSSTASCGHGHDVPKNAKQMGQTIDIFNVSSKDQTTTNGNGTHEQLRKTSHEDEKRVKERREKIQEQLESMTVLELLQTVMKCHQDRVATYKEFERGLSIVLDTGNVTTYPATVAKATASFAVSSDTVKRIQSILQKNIRKRQELADMLKKLQSHEKDKLHFTAAYHLERIRQKNHDMEKDDVTNETTARLLQEGAVALKQKIATCIEGINEIVEELQCAILEENEAAAENNAI